MLQRDRKSTRLNSSHVEISYAVFCLKKKKKSGATGKPESGVDRGPVRVQGWRAQCRVTLRLSRCHREFVFQRKSRFLFFFFNDTATTEIYTLSLPTLSD